MISIPRRKIKSFKNNNKNYHMWFRKKKRLSIKLKSKLKALNRKKNKSF